MNRLIVRLILFLLITLNCGQAKNFEISTGQNPQYSKRDLDAEFIFPKDHGAHPTFKTEWWYITANLTDTLGNPFGIQWTLFRSTLKENAEEKGWSSSQIWMGHSAVTTQNNHFFTEKFARGGVGQAGVNIKPFEAWIDDWAFTGDWKESYITASSDEFSYKMKLSTDKPLIFHGKAGVSQKSHDGAASFYYSQPFFKIEGDLEINDKNYKVSGKAWADREWSNQILSKSQTGWNWLALHLNDGSKIMVFEVRSANSNSFFSGTRIHKDGSSEPLNEKNFTLKPSALYKKEKAQPQLHWQIEIPQESLRINVKPINPNSFMDTIVPYWEGPISFTGTHSGVGYLEVTLDP